MHGLIAVAVLASCGGESPRTADGPVAVFRLPRSADEPLFDLPWPTDLRRTAAGMIDASAFPNPSGAPLVDTYKEALGDLDGYATSGSVYFRFSAAIDPASLPADPAASREEGSTVLLVDVDPESASFGVRRPVRTRIQEEATAFWPLHALAVLPVHGFVLDPGTTYAAVLTTGIRAADGAAFERDQDLDALLGDGGDETVGAARAVYGPAIDSLETLGVARETILSIAVFTTEETTRDLFAGADVVRDEVEAPAAREWFQAEARGEYTIVIGRWGPMPNFQTGVSPFLETGGTFEMGADGRPVVQSLDEGRFSVTVPTGAIAETGCPVVIYAHGTGGDYLSYTRDGTAAVLAARGLCAMGFDQVLHGERSPPGDATGALFFNFLNPLAGRDNARQSALDVVQEARLAAGLVVPGRVLPGGADVVLDASRVLFMGHSQGGLNGPLFFAVDGTAKGAVFSGAGGGLNISLIEKKEPFDILAIVSLVLDVDPTMEGLDMFHPIATLAQTLAEPADVLNYGRYWFASPAEGIAPRSVLMTEGLLDVYTPPASIEALAIAGGLSLVEPVAREIEGMTLAGRPPLEMPVRGNADGVTAALLQFPDDGHFAVFQNDRAKELFGDFLATVAADGVGQVGE